MNPTVVKVLASAREHIGGKSHVASGAGMVVAFIGVEMGLIGAVLNGIDTWMG